MSAVQVTANGEAAALWTSPEGPGPTESQIAERWEAEMAPQLPDETLDRMDRRFEAAAERIGPSAELRYLGVLATHPNRRNRGYARAVLAPVLERDDHDGIGAYLALLRAIRLQSARGDRHRGRSPPLVPGART